MKLNVYHTKQEVAENFSKYLADVIATKKKIHIALSGGSTPKIIFDVLAENYADKIDWQKVNLYWGDERCVPPSDDDSNYKMTVTHLLTKITIPEENIHRVKGENNTEYEAKRYSEVLDEVLPKVNELPQFDLVILGMGDDGHTASIFPHEIDLWHSPNNCEVAVHPKSGQQRITITGKLINNAETVAFLVTGKDKTEKVTEIIKSEGNYKDYPARLVVPRTGNLLWFLDAEAAKGVTLIES